MSVRYKITIEGYDSDGRPQLSTSLGRNFTRRQLRKLYRIVYGSNDHDSIVADVTLLMMQQIKSWMDRCNVSQTHLPAWLTEHARIVVNASLG